MTQLDLQWGIAMAIALKSLGTAGGCVSQSTKRKTTGPPDRAIEAMVIEVLDAFVWMVRPSFRLSCGTNP